MSRINTVRSWLRRIYYLARRYKEPYKTTWQLEYDLIQRPSGKRGRINILNWDIEYVDSRALYHMIKVNVLEKYNDFYSDNPSPRILDCGANIGISVLRYKQLYPAARITAFEADPDLCCILRRNMQRNNAIDVEVIEAAVWCRDELVDFASDSDSQAGRITNGNEVGGRIKRVQGVSLLRFLESQVDLLKLDIEGAEFEVMPSVKSRLHNVMQIMLEIHHRVDRPDRLRDIFGILSEAGFSTIINAKWAPPSYKPYTRNAAGFDEPFLIWAWR